MKLCVIVARGLGAGHTGPYGNRWVSTPSLNALALEGAAREERGTVGADFNAAFNGGVLLVTYCFGQVAQVYGYRVVFLLVAGLTGSGCFMLPGQMRKSLLARPS